MLKTDVATIQYACKLSLKIGTKLCNRCLNAPSALGFGATNKVVMAGSLKWSRPAYQLSALIFNVAEAIRSVASYVMPEKHNTS